MDVFAGRDHDGDVKLPEGIRLFDVEDRAVVLVHEQALVHDGGKWTLLSKAFARKTMLDGYVLGWEEFSLQFPEAAATMPVALLTSLANR